jgi:DtxR family transcriptional regulator, Mn-dependent transcriptional regulator
MAEPIASHVQEDYLEAILFLAEEGGPVRSRDIAERLGTHKSTVSNQLRNLVGMELVSMERYGYVALTNRGRTIAEQVAYRHRQLKTFLQDTLLLDEATAEANACRMEHAVDIEVVERLARFVELINACPDDARFCFRRFRDEISGHGQDATVEPEGDATPPEEESGPG